MLESGVIPCLIGLCLEFEILWFSLNVTTRVFDLRHVLCVRSQAANKRSILLIESMELRLAILESNYVVNVQRGK